MRGEKMNIKLISIIFIALMLALNGLAQTTECSLIKLNTGIVEANNNSKTLALFTITNYSGETFFVDRVNTYDFVSGIISRTKEFSKEILPGKTGKIIVEFDVFVNELKQYRAFIQVRGHFQNQSTCNYFDIGEKEITIIVKNEEIQSTSNNNIIENFSTLDCKAIDVIVPEKVGILNNDGEITINVYNLSGTGMNILLTGNNLKLKSNFIHLPDKTQKDVQIKFTAENDRTWLIYRIEVPGCKTFTKETEIIKINPLANESTQQNADTNASNFNSALATLASLTNPLSILFIILVIIIFALIAAVYIKDQHIREKQNLEFLKERIVAPNNNYKQ